MAPRRFGVRNVGLNLRFYLVEAAINKRLSIAYSQILFIIARSNRLAWHRLNLI